MKYIEKRHFVMNRTVDSSLKLPDNSPHYLALLLTSGGREWQCTYYV